MTRDPEPHSWDLGWYPDPEDPDRERFWNGSEWTRNRPREVERAAPTERRPPWAMIAVGVVVTVIAVALGVVLLDEGEVPEVVEDDAEEFSEATVTDCDVPSADDAPIVRGEVENRSSGRSDYAVEVEVVSADGTRLGTGRAAVDGVEPDQRAAWLAETDVDPERWDDGTTCEITAVERTASL